MKLSPNTGRAIGENAQEKVVRLLKRLNERFTDLDVEGMENITLTIDKSGRTVVIAEGLTRVTALFRAVDQAHLLRFLESPLAAQVLQIALTEPEVRE